MRRVVLLPSVLLVLVYLALAGGRNWLGPVALVQGLTDTQDFLIYGLRLPRVLIAVGAGLALGIAGALMQGLTRNPLATPDIIGLTQGAGLGYAVALIADVALLAGAACGAAGAMMAVIILARGRGALAFVLFGIGIGASAVAVTTILLVSAPDAKAARAMIWLSGSLSRADLATAGWLWLVLMACGGIIAVRAHDLGLLWLGDDAMVSLGTDLPRMRFLVLGLVTALSAASTLAVGPIGFVAFVAAPLARSVTGAEAPAIWPAALTGACLLAASDLAARLIAPVAVFPTGLIMGLIGAPYLIFFLWREKQGASA
ncbi:MULTISPECIES: FecCD family ABC transporter permease [Roseobacteraceae]|uniref:Putative siderophore transport system permease protein YfhA n=1 Tax=Pseudosulfitobacter pseudonitzschiae TaxID=1402135 RepID=A0A221JWD4_9RHOB|nr:MULTISPECIES: iron ABC transporter permease [Roseobacteraceae]ASM71003.1 putative siderophore transport system permease protein YfhA [Pseudosulfitobacter pseudonitzschiae]